MAELEIHHEEGENHSDPMGQKVGVLAAMLAVALAVVTIASHREHTAAIIHKSDANDAWSHYQSVRVKYHNVELGQDLIKILGVKNEEAAKLVVAYASDMNRYESEGSKIQAEAKRNDEASTGAEGRALRFDLGEGLLEISLVLSSLYFISKKKMFPALGIIAGTIGAAVAVMGWLL